MHNKFYYIWISIENKMKDITADYALRATWQAVTKMYNEEAKNYDTTMAIGFTLLSIDPKRKPNPDDGRGVLIYLTDLGLEKRRLSKEVVMRFNEVLKLNIPNEKLQHFFEVTETINKLIAEKKIYIKNSTT